MNGWSGNAATIATVGLALLATVDRACAWEYTSIDGYHRVRVESDGHSLHFLCSRDRFMIAYYVPRAKFVEELAASPQLHLLATPDESDGDGMTGAISARISGIDDLVTVHSQGPAATRMAAFIAKARRDVVVGLTAQDPAGTNERHNPAVFPAAGAAHAIKSLFDACGIKF